MCSIQHVLSYVLHAIHTICYVCYMLQYYSLLHTTHVHMLYVMCCAYVTLYVLHVVCCKLYVTCHMCYMQLFADTGQLSPGPGGDGAGCGRLSPLQL